MLHHLSQTSCDLSLKALRLWSHPYQVEKVDVGEWSQYVSFCSNKPFSCKSHLGWFLPVLMLSARLLIAGSESRILFQRGFKSTACGLGGEVVDEDLCKGHGNWTVSLRFSRLSLKGPRVMTHLTLSHSEGCCCCLKHFIHYMFIIFFPFPQLLPDPFHLPCLNACFSFSLFQKETKQNPKIKTNEWTKINK